MIDRRLTMYNGKILKIYFISSMTENIYKYIFLICKYLSLQGLLPWIKTNFGKQIAQFLVEQYWWLGSG